MKHRRAVCTFALGASAMVSVGAGAPPTPSHVMVLVLENRAHDEIIGSPNAPYLNSLAQGGASLENFYAETHPSQPNYFELFAGSNQANQNNTNPASGAPFTTPNLGAALLQAGATFTGYCEALPSVGYTGAVAPNYYTRIVNPWVNWQGTGTNQIPATLNRPFSTLPSDFSQLPDVCFVVPSIANSMHNNSVASGDAWVQANIGPYAAWAMTNNSLLIVTFDEDNNFARNRIPTIFYGPMVRVGPLQATYTHHNLLRTLCDMFGAVPPGSAANVRPITGVFQTDDLGAVCSFQQGAGYASAHDTWLDPTDPNHSKNTTSYLDAGGPGFQTLLRFDDLFGGGPGQVPVGSTILSAKLKLVTNGDISRDVFTIHRMLVPWADGVTWNSMGGGVNIDDVEAASVPESQLIPNFSPMTVVFDVTGAVQGWSNGTLSANGLLIRSSGSDTVQFRSSEVSTVTDRPQLEITYDAGAPCINYTVQPASQSIVRGQPATFTTATIAPDAVVYQWYREGDMLSDGAVYSGTSTGTLTIASCEFNLAGNFRVATTTSCGSSFSSWAHLTVLCDDVPTITSQPPAYVQVNSGQPIVLNATVSAQGALTYQWQRAYSDTYQDLADGQSISGVLTPSLTITNAGVLDDAEYRLLAYTYCSSVISNSTLVNVICHADVNGDGFVNGDDFDQFMVAFQIGDPFADYDANGFVNGDDFDQFAVDFDAGC